MSTKISERAFEEAIERELLRYGPDAYARDEGMVYEPEVPFGARPPGGYRKRGPRDYRPRLCLLPDDVVDFVLATQPETWKRLAGTQNPLSRSQKVFVRMSLATHSDRRTSPPSTSFTIST